MEWVKIKAGSWGTHDGWNAWRVGSRWQIRSPRGNYYTAQSLRAARQVVESGALE